jgi:hypothetical protein
LVDALTSLGYATLTSGRLNLTETGARLADADLQRAYAFFREGALERVPRACAASDAHEHSADELRERTTRYGDRARTLHPSVSDDPNLIPGLSLPSRRLGG